MKKKLLIVAGVLVVLLVVAVIIVGMSLGSIIKKGVETVGPTITKTDMKLDSASLSILGGSGTLKGFLLGNPEGYKTASAIKAGSISVGVQPRSLFSEKIHVTHVRMEGPEITFEGNLGTANNLSKILANVEATTGGSQPADKSKTQSEGASKKLQVDEFTITGAKVNLSMTMLSGTSVPVTIPDIHFKDLGTGPEGITAAELTQKVLNSITLETIKAAEKAAREFGKNATEALNKGATNLIDQGMKGVGDIFKKK